MEDYEMKKNKYFSSLGGMPDPKSSLDERAVFTEACFRACMLGKKRYCSVLG